MLPWSSHEDSDYDEKGEYAIVSAELDGKMIWFTTGSRVIVKQLRRIKEDDNFPIGATIIKRKSEDSKREYYTLS